MIPVRQHFNLTHIPFIEATPETPCQTEDLKSVCSDLERLKLSGGLALCCGETGTGKTFAVESWTKTLNANTHSIRWLDDPGATNSAFLRRMVRCLDIEPAFQSEEVWCQLTQALRKHHKDTGKQLFIILDEMQDISPMVLDQIRRLTNLWRRGPLPLGFILIAHREFLVPLSRQHLAAFRDRLVVKTMVQGLTRDEVILYLQYHLQRAGAHSHIFGDDAVQLLWSASCGFPRRLNTLALNCMVKAIEKNVQIIEASLVDEIITQEGVK